MQKKPIISQKSYINGEYRRSRPPLLTNGMGISSEKLPKHSTMTNIRENTNMQSNRTSSRLLAIKKRGHRKSQDQSLLHARRASDVKAGFKSQSQSPNKVMIYPQRQSFLVKRYHANNVENGTLNRAFKLIYRIGFGALGKVWKVEENSTQRDFAMKSILKKLVILKDSVQSIINERIILSHLRHSFIINMHQSFQDEENLYLTMDYLRGGDLRYHLCYRNVFTEQEARFVIACLIIAVQYVHQKGIIHRDIKPQNIVFQENGYPRLTDFGIAKHLSTNKFNSEGDPSGTPGYMAPEVICKESQSFVSDFFSIGIICYEMMFQRRPYIGANRLEIRRKMERFPVRLETHDIPLGWSSSSADFTTKLLSRNPETRLGFNNIAQLKEHPWMRTIKWKKLQEKKVTPPFIPNVVCETRKYLREIQNYGRLEDERQGNLQRFKGINIDLYQHYFAEYDHTVEKRTQKVDKHNQKNKENIHSYHKRIIKCKRHSCEDFSTIFHNS